MRIAVIGAGNVGRTLGARFGAAGYDVRFGVRDPDAEKYRALAHESKIAVAGVGPAAGAADVVVLATPWEGTKAAIESAGDLSGKIVVDCTNPLAPDLSGLVVSGGDSGGESVGRWAKGARVVKAFNTVGFSIMADPKLDGRAAALFVCGDDDDARRAVAGLAEAIGFEPIEAGPLSTARLLESFALLWITMAFRLGFGRDFAFSVVRR